MTINCGMCGRFTPKRNKVFCRRSCRLTFSSRGSISPAPSKPINTIYTQKSNLDQFYTAPAIAKLCYDKLWELFDKKNFDLFLEPSAGKGSFLSLFPISKRVGLDLDPKGEGIVKQDFFAYVPPTNTSIITIGNPPFGRVCSLAIKFFNAAAKFSSVIAFIIPKTFRKSSLQNKLDLNFRLVSSTDLPENSFLFNEKPYDVPCCFQIWERTVSPRRVQKQSLNNEYFEFVKKNEADFAVRRVGGRTGKAMLQTKELSETSHYFLKTKPGHSKEDLVAIINTIIFGEIISATAGVKSLSKPEFISGFLNQIRKASNGF